MYVAQLHFTQKSLSAIFAGELGVIHKTMIEKTIESLVKELSPSDGDNLLGMDYDICHYFDTSDATKFISREQTNNNKCMFIINLEATEAATDIGSVTESLSEAWECIMYNYFECGSIEKYKEMEVLRFVTVIGKDSFYVTGKAVVSGERYLQLAKKYESSFSELPNA